jgi:hypothetical protein
LIAFPDTLYFLDLPLLIMKHEENALKCAFACKIDNLMDLANVDMHELRPQTTSKNRDLLLRWAQHMSGHEMRTKKYERVYLVASELRSIA